MKLIIMQGIPGSGKDYVVERDYPDAVVCSADNYFRALSPNYDKGGEGFDFRKLGKAHSECYRKAYVALRYGRNDLVVINNTNLDNESIASYVSLGRLFNYEIEICRVKCDEDIAFERNTHGVPAAVYARMASNFSRWKLWPPHKACVTVRTVDNNPSD